MKCVEKEEERIAIEEPTRMTYHLCIVNLVIGTLYCSKGNYTFGVSRIVKSLEPYNKKLGTDTWFYAKRCLLSLIETLAKHMMVLPDASFNEVLNFLDAIEIHGKTIKTVIDPLADDEDTTNNADGTTAPSGDSKKTVAYEAKLIKRMFLKLRE